MSTENHTRPQEIPDYVSLEPKLDRDNHVEFYRQAQAIVRRPDGTFIRPVFPISENEHRRVDLTLVKNLLPREYDGDIVACWIIHKTITTSEKAFQLSR